MSQPALPTTVTLAHAATRAAREAAGTPRPRTPLGWRLAAGLVSLALFAPVIAGLAGVLLPALGYFPALGTQTIGTDVIEQFLAEPGVLRSALVSGLTGLIATAVSVVITAFILAAAFGTRALLVAERLLAPILSVPHAAAALGFVFLFAPSGFLLRLLSPWATGLEAPPDLLIIKDPWGWSLVAALVIKEVPFLFLMALAALPQVRSRERAAVARTLGYGAMAGFLLTVWPLVYRQLRLPVLAVLAFSVSVVDMALILGPTRPPTLAVRIVGWLRSSDLSDWLVGSAAAVAIVLLVVALIVVWLGLERLVGAGIGWLRFTGWRFRRERALRTLILALAALGVAIVFAGFAGLILQSFAGYWPFPDTRPTTMSAHAWATRLPMAGKTLGNTLIVALGAAAIALPLAVLLLEASRRGVRVWWLIYTPLIVPQVAFLFGLSVLSVAAGVSTGLWAVTISHALFALPYALIALSGPWAALDPRYEAVAASVGAGGLRRFCAIRLQLMAAPLAVAAALCVAVSVGLYLPTQMIGGGRVATVTTEAVAASSGGDRRLIGMFVTLQLVIPLCAFALARGAPLLLRIGWPVPGNAQR